MSNWTKILVGIFLVSIFLLITDAVYFFDFPQNLLNQSVNISASLTPSPTPLLVSTPTDKIIWHDMSDIKFNELDINHLTDSLIKNWLATASGAVVYKDPYTFTTVKVYPGKFKSLVKNSLSIIQGQKDVNFTIPLDSSARLWEKTAEKLYVASPSLDQIAKYNLVSSGIKPDDLVLVYETKNINSGQNSQGLWLIKLSPN